MGRTPLGSTYLTRQLLLRNEGRAVAPCAGRGLLPVLASACRLCGLCGGAAAKRGWDLDLH